MKKSVLLILLFLSVMMYSQAGSVVSLNFQENTNQNFTGGLIGPLGTQSLFWNRNNNASGSWAYGTAENLVDDQGIQTGIDVTWLSSNTWYTYDDGTSTDEKKLSVGYLDDGDPNTANAVSEGLSVVLTNIPYATYNVYGLYASDSGTSMVNFNVNGTWALGGDETTTAAVYSSATACYNATGQYWVQIDPGVTTGNYWKVTTTGPTCTVAGQPRDGGNRGSLTGIIIENADDPYMGYHRSIGHNFQSYESASGWGYHWYLSRSSNPGAGYYDPNGILWGQHPTANWNEGIYKDQTYQAKDDIGAVGPTMAVHTGTFEWHTSWYQNMDNFFNGSIIQANANPWEFQDAKNKYRVAVGFIGHNGNAQPAKPLTALKKVPYGKYKVITYMHPNRNDDQQQLTIEDQTYYYLDQHGADFQTSLLADPNDGGWLFATETTSPATKQANIAVFSGLTEPDMTIYFQTPANSGISGYELIAEELDMDVSSNPTPASEDKSLGGTPYSIDGLLTWDPPVNYTPDSYDLYIGEYGDPNWALTPAATGLTVESFDPVLEYGKAMVWRVDSHEGVTVHTGDLWYFDVEGDPVIQVQPRSVSVQEGSNTFFDIDSVLTDNYAWYYSPDAVNDTPGDDVLLQDGPDAQVDILDVALADVGYYYVVLTNTIPDSAAIVSEVASLEIGQLELYLPFDGDPNDASGNDWLILPGNRIVDANGVYVGPANGEISYQTGWDGVGEAAKFTRGSGDQLEVIGSDDYFNFFPKGFTVRFWVKPTYGQGGYLTYMGKSSNGWNPPDTGWRMFDEGEYASQGFVADMSPLTINNLSGGRLDDGSWHLVACTYDGATQEMKVYYNGFLEKTLTGALDGGTTYPLVIGNQYKDGTGGWGYEGLMDEIEVFSYAISEYDMLEDYATKTGQEYCLADIAGDVNKDCKDDLKDIAAVAAEWLDSTNPGTTPSTRVVQWKFDETSGLTAADSSGNGIVGTLGVGFADDADAQWVIDGGRTGVSGDNALYFNGDPNTFVIADANAISQPFANGAGNIFEGTASWTMNLWIKFVNTTAMVNIGGFGYNEWPGDPDPDGNSDRYFASYSGGYEFEVGQDGIWPSNAMTTDWTMMTATYDGTTCVVYLDGVQVDQADVALVDALEEINLNTARRVLWDYDNVTVPLTGTIDDFSIWSEAFNAAQVMGMYLNNFPSCDGALVADLNGDCEVDVNDLLLVANDWLECQRVPSSLCSD